MEKLITVIIAVYNSLSTLEGAVDSVRAQSLGFEKLYVILADDCSSNGTGELCEELAAREPENITALHLQRNSGSPGSPRNAALPLVQTPYLMFLDDDDRLCERGCEVLLAAMEKSGADVVSGSCRAVSEERIAGFDPNAEIFRNDGLAEGEYELQKLTEENCLAFCIGLCTKLYRRDIVEKYSLRFADGEVGEDNPFLYLYTLLSRKGYVIKDEVFERYARSASLSRSHNARFFAGIARAANYGLSRAEELGLTSEYEALLSKAGLLEHMLDTALKEAAPLWGEELRESFSAWADMFSRAYKGKIMLHSPYAKILSQSAVLGDMEKALFDYSALRDFYMQRQSELDAIFAAKSWRLAQGAQKLLGRR